LVRHPDKRSIFAIFDAFPTRLAGRPTLAGRVAAALMKSATELLSVSPGIDKAEVLARPSCRAEAGQVCR